MARKRETPEEIAERIVWGVQNAFVSETTGFLVDRLTSVDFLDYNAEYWVQRFARENPALLNDILLQYQDKIAADVRKTLTDYLRDYDTERALQEFTGHTEPSTPYVAASERLTNATVKGCTEIIARQNVALVEQQANLWYDVASVAVTRANASMMARKDIIADAVKELSARQLFTVDYKSGVHNKIDVAIRRHVVTQLNQNYQRFNDLRAKEYDLDLFMCSSHVASRPEHYDLQGKIYSKGRYIGQRIDGHKVEDYAEMAIGSVTGIYGANCTHYTTPYIPGLSQLQEPPYNKKENDKRYELTQQQRYYERQIRATKSEIADLQRAGLDDSKARLRLGAQQARVRDFCDKNDLTRRLDLERAYGIGAQPRALRGSAPKASTPPASASGKDKKTTPPATTPKTVTQNTGITAQQIEAVEWYVSGEGMYINNAMRGIDPLQLNAKENEAIALIRQATKTDTVDVPTLYRSVDATAVFGRMTQLQFSQLEDALIYGDDYARGKVQGIIDRTLGKRITDKGFLSTTESKTIAAEWRDFTGSDKPIVLQLNNAQGTQGLKVYDLFKEVEKRDPQREVLLPDNTTYTVTDIGAQDGVIFVQAELLNMSK